MHDKFALVTGAGSGSTGIGRPVGPMVGFSSGRSKGTGSVTGAIPPSVTTLSSPGPRVDKAPAAVRG